MRLRDEIKRRFPDLLIQSDLPEAAEPGRHLNLPGRPPHLTPNPSFTFSELQRTLSTLGALDEQTPSNLKPLTRDRANLTTDFRLSGSASLVSIESSASELHGPDPSMSLSQSAKPDPPRPLSKRRSSPPRIPDLPSFVSDSGQSPRLRTTLYLPHFTHDFDTIHAYCLDPTGFDLSRDGATLHPLSRALIELMDSHRLKELRKEQKIKKILNLIFKTLLRRYTERTHPHLLHVTDSAKRQFYAHYFSEISGQDSLFSRPDYRSRKVQGEIRPLNLTYNAKFFKNVQKCELFVGDMLVALEELRGQASQIIRGDVWRLLKRLEAFMAPSSSPDGDLARLHSFFEKKNAYGSKVGIKIPWSQQQILDSIDLVRYLASPQRRL